VLALALIAHCVMPYSRIFQFVEQHVERAEVGLRVMIILLFLVISGYFAFFEWIWSGQTPGKRWLKLRVIREDGRPITFLGSVGAKPAAHARHVSTAVLLELD
jgi:uncharacterized RDD family membrane protein YckC